MEIERLSFPTPWSRHLFEQDLITSIAKAFVARDSATNRTVGYLCLWEVAGEAHILNLAVHPARLRQGIGAALLSHGIGYCRKKGVQDVTLEVRRSNIKAISLYRHFHFHPRGVRPRYYTDSGEDAVIMGRMLENEKPE